MFDELKQKSFKSSLPATIVIAIAAVIITVFMANRFLYVVKGFDNFNSLAPDEIKNQLVEADIDLNWGCFMERYSRNKNTHVEKSEYLYYIIATGDDEALDYRYMAIKVRPSLETRMEAMADDTYDGYFSDPIHFNGEIKKMSSDELAYFRDYFIESGWTAAEVDEETIPYYIDAQEGSSGLRGVYGLVLAGTVLLFVIAIFRFVKALGGGYLKKFTKDYESAGYVESSVGSDFARAEKDATNETLRFGDLFVYWTSGTTPRAIATKEICWAYQNTTTHRTNGIKTGTTYSVEIYQAHNKEHFSVPVKNETTARYILERIGQKYPWVFVGYGDELARTYNKNRNEFLDIRYNKVDRDGTGAQTQTQQASYWDPFGDRPTIQ